MIAMTDPTREAFDSDVDLMRDVYMLPSQRGACERILQAALSARAQQAVDKETLVAFERVFWKAVELSGSRDFDHDVCKEVRDFRSLLAALPDKTEVDRG